MVLFIIKIILYFIGSVGGSQTLNVSEVNSLYVPLYQVNDLTNNISSNSGKVYLS